MSEQPPSSVPTKDIQPLPVPPQNHGPGVVRRLVGRVGSSLKTSFAILGVAAAAGLYMEYKSLQSTVDETEESDTKKRKVLVIPFHKIDLVERKSGTWRSELRDLGGLDRKEDQRTTLEVRELVDILHHAASDPQIVALYGIFGHGSQMSTAGWADLEEVRNALRVFREAHRRHPEPNVNHQIQVIPRMESKPMYAYCDSFSSMGDPANKEYYLASIFTHIHMQMAGELNLWGMLSTQFFLRDFLSKYGIVAHVFKHGEYKNTPNMFTEKKFNRAHRENVETILQSINSSVCQEMSRSRSEALLTSWLKMSKKSSDQTTLWKRIHESGTFPASTAWKAGLIDYLPKRDPLPDLLASNSNEKAKDVVKAKWDCQETDFDRFTAEKAIHIKDYAKSFRKKEKAEKRKSMWEEHGKPRGPLADSILSLLGMKKSVNENDVQKKEKVVVLFAQAQDGIMDSTARRLVHSIRKIRKDKDVKCLILRVNSPGGSIVPCETIRQELASLEVPLVVSFGNVSASGGYYISSTADRIFASRKTITGSIGVFGIRMDLTQLAKDYGITVDHVATGDLAATFSPFHPLSRRMRKQIGDAIDRYYALFKQVVSDGRKMPMDNVEAIAKGRVWTGEQAKSNGLVDELGGLHRAIAYAKRTYTTAGMDAEVVTWPPQRGLFRKILESFEDEDPGLLLTMFLEYCGAIFDPAINAEETSSLNRNITHPFDWLLKSAPNGLPGTLSGVLLTTDENTAIRCLLSDLYDRKQAQADLFPSSFWK